MNPQHRHQRIGRTSAFTLGVVGLDQGNQTLPWHYPIHFDQEQLFAGLLALAGVLGVGESHLLHRATRRVGSGYFAKSGSLLQSVLRIAAIRPELTLIEAADLLDVSRLRLVELLEQNAIPYTKIGRRSRVKTADVMAYKQRQTVKSRQAMDELSKQAQALGMGYERGK
ncbi:hypothetical protein PXNS11_10001 [Stutzerimonas xanthomarina]|nr:hypothetical protein PXNS11_10001 [Stutzerimonas xanthomarina]